MFTHHQIDPRKDLTLLPSRIPNLISPFPILEDLTVITHYRALANDSDGPDVHPSWIRRKQDKLVLLLFEALLILSKLTPRDGPANQQRSRSTAYSGCRILRKWAISRCESIRHISTMQEGASHWDSRCPRTCFNNDESPPRNHIRIFVCFGSQSVFNAPGAIPFCSFLPR